MSKVENRVAHGSLPINEGLIKKGGINTQPVTPRPAPPSGQSGASQSNQGTIGTASQGSQ